MLKAVNDLDSSSNHVFAKILIYNQFTKEFDPLVWLTKTSFLRIKYPSKLGEKGGGGGGTMPNVLVFKKALRQSSILEMDVNYNTPKTLFAIN